MDRDWRGIVLAEIVIVWVLYLARHGRLGLLKSAIDGSVTINTYIPSAGTTPTASAKTTISSTGESGARANAYVR